MPSTPDPSAFMATLAAVTNLNKVAVGVLKLLQMVRSQFGKNWSRQSPEQKRAERLLNAQTDVEEKKLLVAGDYELKEYKLRKDAEIRRFKKALKEAEHPPPEQDILDIDVLLLDEPEADIVAEDKSPFEYVEQRRLNNTKQVMRHAIKALPEHQEVSDHPVDPDLQSRIFGTVQDVSTTEMQQLWGRLLAGEIARPGSYSLRTLEVLRNLSRDEARLFERVCHLCTDEGVIALPVYGNRDTIIPYDELLHLVECGLVYHGCPPRTPVDLVHLHGKSNELSLSVSGKRIVVPLALTGVSFVLTVPGRQLRSICASRTTDKKLFEAYYAEILRQQPDSSVVDETEGSAP